MSDIVIFNTGKTPQHLKSVDASEYSGDTVLVNPDLSAVGKVVTKYWKNDGGVVEMAQAEKDVLDTAELQARKDATTLSNELKAIITVLSGSGVFITASETLTEVKKGIV